MRDWCAKWLHNVHAKSLFNSQCSVGKCFLTWENVLIFKMCFINVHGKRVIHFICFLFKYINNWINSIIFAFYGYLKKKNCVCENTYFCSLYLNSYFIGYLIKTSVIFQRHNWRINNLFQFHIKVHNTLKWFKLDVSEIHLDPSSAPYINQVKSTSFTPPFT